MYIQAHGFLCDMSMTQVIGCLTQLTHQGLKSGYETHSNRRNDLLEVTQLPQQAQQPEGPQHPQLLDPRVPALPAAVDEEQEHRQRYNQRVEQGPAIWPPHRDGRRAFRAVTGDLCAGLKGIGTGGAEEQAPAQPC
jgi:hypothetical protein